MPITIDQAKAIAKLAGVMLATTNREEAQAAAILVGAKATPYGLVINEKIWKSSKLYCPGIPLGAESLAWESKEGALTCWWEYEHR